MPASRLRRMKARCELWECCGNFAWVLTLRAGQHERLYGLITGEAVVAQSRLFLQQILPKMAGPFYAASFLVCFARAQAALSRGEPKGDDAPLKEQECSVRWLPFSGSLFVCLYGLGGDSGQQSPGMDRQCTDDASRDHLPGIGSHCWGVFGGG